MNPWWQPDTYFSSSDRVADRSFLVLSARDFLLKPGRNSLLAILDRCGIALPSDQVDLLWSYHQLLRAANARLNLTRIHNFENMVLKHYVDSLLILDLVDLPSPLIDMGSGPGLPGIPLKIARPQVEMILAEPRGARAEFLSEVCTELGLQGVEVYPRKVGPNYPGKVQGVITRAVGSVSQTLERVALCLVPGGKMIFMKGPECDDEIAAARQEHAKLFRLATDRPYEIPGTPHKRRLLVYERQESPGERLSAQSGEILQYQGRVREVTSESNPSFRHFRDLLGGRGIRKHSQALIAGPRIVAEVMANHLHHAAAWITDHGGSPPASGPLVWYRLAPALFRELDVAGTKSPLLLVNVPSIPAWSDDDPWPEGCTLFIPFQDPENVGAVLRSAAAFGVARVVLLREAAHPFHPKSSRAAGTALFQLSLFQGPSIHELESHHAPIIALDTTGPELSECPFPATFGLVAGVEGPGLPDKLRQGERRGIAMTAEVKSLNAATAAAIALYAWSRERTARSST
jgi:16S rRNA (guanine(527)-N(7))-methyltransferase RsmG